MQIFYVGQIGVGQTCRDRMLALRDLGNRVEAFDTTPYLTAQPRVMRSLAHRLNVGRRLERLNDDLMAWVRAMGRADMIWVDKGKWIFPETVMEARRATRAVVVHYTPDAQLLINRSRYFRAALSLYDTIITTKPFEVAAYKRLHAKRVLLTGQAYDEVRVAGAIAAPVYASEVSFIGHAEPWYRQLLATTAQSPDVKLRVWGSGWTRWRYRRSVPVAGIGLYGEAYIAALKAARIGIGLLQKRIPETSTTRSFEIPACGTFLLAERTGEHQQFFTEGKEAEYFSSAGELIEKARFYLHDERARERIAHAGFRRCQQSGYGNRSRLARALRWIVDDAEPFCDQRFGVTNGGY